MSKFLALPLELILEVADHLPANDLVRLARSNRWLFRVLSPRVDTVALKYRVPGLSHRPSVLHWAVANNHLALVKRLVALGATIHGFRDERGPFGPDSKTVQSALDLAVENGNYQVAEVLLAHGAEVNAYDPFSSRTPICAAAAYDKLELAELLLTHGADPHQREDNEDTPLHYAAAFQSCALVEKLISLGVDVNAPNRFGVTPLSLHCVAMDFMDKQSPHYSSKADVAATITRKLLDAGANRNRRSEDSDGIE
jgi:ankyrin repeat protein